MLSALVKQLEQRGMITWVENGKTRDIRLRAEAD
jgi:hypothetical protein